MLKRLLLYSFFFFIGITVGNVTAQSVSVSGTVTDVSCNGDSNGLILYHITGGPGPIHYYWNTGDSGIASGSCTYIVHLNNPGIALSQFQIRVDVSLMPGMNADFTNLFFMDSAGNHIPFWLKDFPTASSATFWVRVPNIPSGNSAIFLSYCGSSTVSESDPYTTFEFFENFDSGNLSNWTSACQNINVTGETCNMAISNTVFFSPGYSLYLSAHGSCFVPPYDGAISTASRTVPMINDSLVFDYNTKVSVELYGFCSGGTNSSNQIFADNVNLGTGQGIGQGGSCAVNTSNWADATSQPFNVTIGSTLITLKTTGGDCDNTQGWWDNVRIRKYRSHPPIVSLDTTPQLTLDSLPAGVYTITMYDLNGNATTSSFTVTEPAPIAFTNDSVNVACFGGADGMAWTNVSGGTNPYTYNWSNATTNDTASNLSAGNYTVTITDNHACSVSTSFSITEPTVLAADADSLDVQCAGTASSKAWVTISGGTIPYNVLWSNSEITDTIYSLATGSYSVTVTDANGCTAQSSTYVNATPPPLVLDVGGVDVSCFGLSDGKAWVIASGGNPGYLYLWNNNQTTDTIVALSGGIYNVTVTDANGCTADTLVQVAAAPPNLLADADSIDVLCFGESTGAVWVNVSGGVFPYNYNWNNSVTTDTASGLAAAAYSVTVTDMHGCTVAANTTVNQPASALSANANSVDAICNGTSTGSASVLASGGTSPYSYLWSNSNTASSLTNIAAGTYYVTVTDANSCSVAANTTVNEPAAISISTIEILPVCVNGSNGAITVQVSNATSPIIYNWSNGDNAAAISGLSQGDYILTVTDANNCSATVTETVVFDNFSVAIQTNPSATIVPGNSVTLTAVVGAADSIWWQPDTYLDYINNTTVLVSPTETIVYTVTAISDKGCYATDSVKITVQPKPEGLFPTGFSPNGDGVNDFFHAILRGPVQLISLTVYNRWGEKVYEQTGDDNTTGWDGTFKGRNAPMGTYVYYAVLKTMPPDQVQLLKYSGNITLIR